MHYVLAPSTFFFSHYFYTGLRIATGIVGLAVLVEIFANLETAVVMATGGLCASLMDLPSPLRHKFNEMLASVLISSSVALIVGLCSPFHLLLTVVIGMTSFAASMLVAYGRKAMPLQFAALFTMMLSGGAAMSAAQAWKNSALFFEGGLAYLAYSMVVSWFLQNRIKQQVLAEALYELGRYMETKADFYDLGKNLRNQFQKLVRQQTVLAEKQQASRDMILRDSHEQRNVKLVQVHYAMIDLYELVLSMHTDYALLRQHFADDKLLPALGRLAATIAQDVESVAYAMARNRISRPRFDYRHELGTIEHELDRHAGIDMRGSAPPEALAILHETVEKIREVLGAVAKLHAATFVENIPLPIAPDTRMTPFLTRQRYGLGIIASQLSWTSPTFRYAVRVAMAISLGFYIARLLPYASHGYWIALTIAVILKPSFSMTRRRRADRVVGTFIGCILTALILDIVHAPAVLLGFLFVATVAGPAFLYIKYRYTAIAASVQTLILIGLTSPAAAQAIDERLLDTLAGAAIATFFSYVLPSWEYQTLPRLIGQVLKSNRSYIEAWRNLLQGRVEDDFRYRVARKRFMDSIASLSSAIVRMQDEPLAKRYAPQEINRFAVQNYLLVAHCAAIRLLLQHYRKGLPVDAVNLLIERVWRMVDTKLVNAQEAFPAAGEVPLVATPKRDERLAALPSGQAWPGWMPLQRHAELMYADAGEMAATARTISKELECAG